MASLKSLCRLTSRLQPLAFKLNNKKTSVSLSADMPFLKSTPSALRFSRIPRLPLELSCLESMMPLHSAIASARLRSSLSIESQNWGLVPQGISLPL